MFGWEFPPHRMGGLATATHGLVTGLTGRGVAVTLVVPFPTDDPPTSSLRILSGRDYSPSFRRIVLESPLAPYDREAEYGSRLREIREGGGSTALYGRDLLDEVERLAAIAGQIAAAEEHDVIDAHDWLTFPAGIEARAASGRPLVAHIHATEYDRAGELGADPMIREREREGLLAADRVISNSHALKQLVVERYGIREEKVSVVHWGIDPRDGGSEGDPPAPAPGGRSSHNPLPEGDPIVLFLGRVTRQKGPDWFVEVAARVARYVPRARFVVAGSGDLLPRVIERAAELDLTDRVHYAGALGRHEVARAYRMASVCVMPSISEPFGLVALESLHHGTPCIVPRRSGVAETLVNVFKVDFWDLDEMTEKIVSLLRYGELLEEMRERGRQELEAPRFSLDEPARLTVEAYRSALRARGSEPAS